MSTNTEILTFENFCRIAEEFAPCMNDYLYVYDLVSDTYYITKRAVERFQLPGNTFHNVLEAHGKFVYPDDLPMLQLDLSQILSGQKQEHNLEYRWLGADGSPVWINCRGRLILDENQTPILMVGCINEIGNQQKADNVSGLPGESFLREHMKMLIPVFSKGMLLRIGIDDFKTLNERHGMGYGNYILKKVADCIQQSLDALQYAYRIVSDEFIILDVSDRPVEAMNLLYHRIRSAVDNLVKQQHYKALYTISGGIVSLEDINITNYEEIFKLTEFALAEAKNRGKNQVYYFRAEDYEAFLQRRYIRSCLRQAISNDFEGFSLSYQPIIMSNGEHLYAAETLLRYRTPDGKTISPYEFIPILEDSGLIIPVGKWIIKNALDMCAECRKKYPDFKISINLSYIQLLKSPMFDEIMDALNLSSLPPNCLIVELTESGHLEDSPAIQNVWRKLKNVDVSIAVDDFGTGYSNLQNIGNLRPNIVKIDRSFTVKALQNEYEFELLVHIIRMVHSIGLNLVVEGVETKDELIKITALNPDFIQGYFYSKPCPKEEFFEKFQIA